MEKGFISSREIRGSALVEMRGSDDPFQVPWLSKIAFQRVFKRFISSRVIRGSALVEMRGSGYNLVR